MLTEANGHALLQGATVIAACPDNLHTRQTITHTARALSLLVVHAAVAGFTGQVTTIPQQTDTKHSLYDSAGAINHGIEIMLGTPPTTVAFAATLQARKSLKATHFA